MKIFYGITKSNFGGAQRYVFDLATEAKKRGCEVTVICGGEGALVEKLKEEDVNIITIPYLKRDISLLDELRSFYFIFQTLLTEKPDIFHTNSSKMGGMGNLAARLAGTKKIIFTGHAWAFNEPRTLWQKPIIKFFVWLTIFLSHRTICVSDKTRSQVASWPFVQNKLVVVKNGITPFELTPRTEHPLTVGTLAELHKVKGLDILLKAWNKFHKKHPKAKLIIMGTGEEKENLKAQARELGITDSVSLKGYVENAKRYLSDFDIFVLPSRSEAMPYTLLEAGLAGLPVIATSVGGVPEVIENGANGILIPPENSEVLFSSLVLLAEDEELRKRLGANLKASIQEDFSFEKMVSQTFALY